MSRDTSLVRPVFRPCRFLIFFFVHILVDVALFNFLFNFPPRSLPLLAQSFRMYSRLVLASHTRRARALSHVDSRAQSASAAARRGEAKRKCKHKYKYKYKYKIERRGGSTAKTSTDYDFQVLRPSVERTRLVILPLALPLDARTPAFLCTSVFTSSSFLLLGSNNSCVIILKASCRCFPRNFPLYFLLFCTCAVSLSRAHAYHACGS